MKATRYEYSDIPEELRTRINNASFFASTGFAQIWSAVGGRDVYRVISNDAGPVLALTTVEFGTGPARRLQVMPDGCYLSPVYFVDDEADRKAALNVLLTDLAKSGYGRIYLYDYHQQLCAHPAFHEEGCRTIVIDISSPDWQPPDKKLQSEIRKAEREGIQAVEFDQGKHFDGFLSLVRHTESRHGRSPKYPPEFYRKLADLAEDDNGVYWRYIEVDGQPAASHIYFVDGDMVLDWQNYFDKAYSYLKPNQYLLYRTARMFAAQGVSILNLGATPGDAEGLVAYKEKWGGQGYSYPCYQHKSFLGRLL